MAVKIGGTVKNSPADGVFLTDDLLISIDNNEINDGLDYNFYQTKKRLSIKFSRNKTESVIKITKDEYEDLGLLFDTYLIDDEKHCKNKCIFCFIDQNPKGMRKSIYFKDDDLRLGFMFGNYVTLTNAGVSDIDRVIKMRISPINISVHTTNPGLREKMLGNKNAGNILGFMQRLKKGGITMNAQIVVCNGINDGEELSKTLADLAGFYPELQSVAVVPAGLTAFRDGLPPLSGFDRKSALMVVKAVEKFGGDFKAVNGERFAYLSDEFYIKAEKSVKSSSFYEDFPQLENGVGMVASFLSDAFSEMKKIPQDDKKRELTLATGVDFYPYLLKAVEKIKEKWYNTEIKTVRIENGFFGSSVTVAGLLTGSDYIKALKGNCRGTLFISGCSLKADEDIFLDGITLETLEKELSSKIIPVKNDGREFVRAVLDL